MSTLLCANIHFESTGNNRIHVVGSNSIVITTTGSNSFVANSTGTFDSFGSVRSVPITPKTTGYTLAKIDNGSLIAITTGGITVPANIFANGDTVSIYNQSGSSQSITTSAVTCFLTGTATSTSPRTLSQRGLATVTCINSTTNEFIISGAGLS